MSLIDETLLRTHAPELLENLKPCLFAIQGATGKPIPAIGVLSLN